MTHPLIAEIHSIPPSRATENCKIGTYLAARPVEDADAVREALAARDADGRYFVSHKSLSNILSKYGLSVGSTLVGEHRRGACACYRSAL